MQLPPLTKKGGLKCEQLQTRRVDMKRHEEEDLGSVQIPWLAAVSRHAKQWHLKDQKKKLHGHARYFSAAGKNTQARPSGDPAVPFRKLHACRMHKVHQRGSEICSKAASGRSFSTL